MSRIANPRHRSFPIAEPEKIFSLIEVGNCSWCGSEHFKCVNCNTIKALCDNDYDDNLQCESCGMEYLITNKYERDGLTEIIEELPHKLVQFEKCGNEFQPDQIIEDIRIDCEYNYGYE